MSNLLLQNELDFYNANKEKYLGIYKNSYVVIKNSKLLGNYSNQPDAYAAGLNEYGNKPFLIKKVEDKEQNNIHSYAFHLAR